MRKSTYFEIGLGLLIFVGLFLPSASFVAHPDYILQQSLPDSLKTLLFFLPSLALVLAALLLKSGITYHRKWLKAGRIVLVGSQMQPDRSGRVAIILLFLCMLILIKTLDNLYWLTIWDKANDPFGGLLLIVPFVAVFFSGSFLAISLPDNSKPIGLFFCLFVPALIFAVFIWAQSIDYHQLTENRAKKVTQAIETYYTREGHYPQNLQQLAPLFIISIPEPVILYGQEWCYQSGIDFYRLGYINREVWFSPILTGQTYKTMGLGPDASHLCDAQIAVVKKSYPDYPWDYSMNSE